MIAAISCLFLLVACGEDAKPEIKKTDKEQSSAVKQGTAKSSQSSPEQISGGIKVRILPDNPSVMDCLSIVVEGQPGRSGVRWLVNGELLKNQTSTRLCGDFFKRDDLVTAEVGTNDVGASVSVTIGNALPRVTDISATPEQVTAGQPLTVLPVAEDADDDDVDFSYQWLVNGNSDPLLTEAMLPGDKFTKGDTVQVLIVPNDFFDDGPTYESYAMVVPNAAPNITSQPPQEITSLDYLYPVEASDPDDSQLTYRLSEAPDGMFIDEDSGLIQWNLAEVSPGDYTIMVIVTDPDGAEGGQGYTLTLGAPQ
jgi:hypothetical protein